MSEASDNALKWARRAEELSKDAEAPDLVTMAELDKAQGMAATWAFTALAQVFSPRPSIREPNR